MPGHSNGIGCGEDRFFIKQLPLKAQWLIDEWEISFAFDVLDEPTDHEYGALMSLAIAPSVPVIGKSMALIFASSQTL
ncbi:hypothetical protein [Acidovorax sp. LjRoot117]|uniref:hypothetical protein n=1 Tax=Acidovorax sp. LjRoot117 TaxID=3342255 RepID=UPI003ECDE623